MKLESTTSQAMEAVVDAPLKGWHDAVERLLASTMVTTRLLAIFGGLMIVAVGFLICLEIVLRSVGITLGVTDEISTYVLAIGSTLAFSHCLVDRAHIRIDSATRFLSSKVSMAVDLIALLSLSGFYSLVAWYALETAWESFRRGSRAVTELQTPLFIPQFLWAAALVLFVLVGAVIILAACSRLLRGNLSGAQDLVATNAADSEKEAHL